MLIVFLINKLNSNNSKSISPQHWNSKRDFILEYEYFYNSTKEDYSQKSYHDGYYKINQTAKYKICVYGAKVFNGRRGGEICGINNFNESDILTYKLGGSEADEKKRKEYNPNRQNGYKFAGYAKINYFDNFLIVVGGGGNSEESLKKELDAGKNGRGNLGGKAGAHYEGGKRDYSNGENSSQYKRGNADSTGLPYIYYGGRRSNFCKANKCLYNETKINEMDYSGVRIYRFKE